MKAIIGLGNPGAEYENTRHNAGFKVIDELLRRAGWSQEREKRSTLGGQTVKYRCAERGRELVAIKPLTFMNASGSAFAAAAKDFGFEPAEALVILDDVHLPLGRIRLRTEGSSGGQKGLEDILRAAGTERIARLRVGVGAPQPPQSGEGAQKSGAPREIRSFVLDAFSPEEDKLLAETIARAADAAQAWVERGAEAAMNQFNGSEKEV